MSSAIPDAGFRGGCATYLTGQSPIMGEPGRPVSSPQRIQ
jgi:hypothetical protein